MAAPARKPDLLCRRCCERRPLGPAYNGCASCAEHGESSPLEVDYDYAWHRDRDTLSLWRDRPVTLWSYRELLPLPASAQPVTLVEGATPLVALDTSGPGKVWVKDETRNPTGAFKDRFHSVSVSMARHLGHTKTVSSTTGNHGASLAAYAARAGMRCVVFVDPRSPDVQIALIQLYGARTVAIRNRREHLQWLVAERGWYPSTGLIPWPMATPFGIEGYKTIGYEIYFQLGHMPHRVLCPVSVGDIIYGPWRGFSELAALGVSEPLPAMHAIQSAGCDPIVQAFEQRADKVPVHPAPDTIALSIGDETAASYTLDAIYQSGGGALSVTDDDLLAAMRVLARHGIAAEPSAAASVAGALAMQGRGELGEEEDVVCVVTGTALKWPETMRLAAAEHTLRDEDPTTVRAWIAAFDVD